MTPVHRSAWKKFERRVARTFGAERNPLSGGNSGHTTSDSRHDTLYIECKASVSHPLIDTWNDHKSPAKRYGLPVVGLLIDPGFDMCLCWHVDAPPTERLSPADNYIVPHYAKRDSLRSLYETEAPKADAEDKTLMLAVGQMRRPGFWIVCRKADVNEIVCAM